MVGGNAPASNPFGAMDAPQQNFDPMQQGMNDPYGIPPMNGPVKAPEKKSKTGIIIAIVAVVLVATAIILCFVFGVFGGGNKDGKYYLDSMSYNGATLEASSLAAFGVDVSTVYLEVNGDKFTLNADAVGTGSVSGDIKFSGSTATFTINGQSIEGKCSGDSITIEYSGAGMTFKKK